MTTYQDVIHDILLELDWNPTDEAIEVTHKMLPRSIKLEAEEWGWDDTCVKDETYSWLEDNGSSFLE
jgi:hypothetical protein